ncbi:hypothetical protein RSOLAG22IIIB_09080 [Rhizoctonia solani]|uniref:HMG box domain-containing protein n=1 Tax=Rhizoctonia solani TaxID=456999 RepID=A0A0K6FWV6_9AGAM|nr:hypothetical protein RSOLAG22IIIB_09080 [Rhizoctonia solani]
MAVCRYSFVWLAMHVCRALPSLFSTSNYGPNFAQSDPINHPTHCPLWLFRPSTLVPLAPSTLCSHYAAFACILHLVVPTPVTNVPPRRTSEPSDDSVDESSDNDALITQALNPDGTPRRPMNAFMIFARRRHPEITANNPPLRTGEVSKVLSSEWAAMSSQGSKQFYLDCARKLKDNFNARWPDYVYRRRLNNSRKRKRLEVSVPLVIHRESPGHEPVVPSSKLKYEDSYQHPVLPSLPLTNAPLTMIYLGEAEHRLGLLGGYHALLPAPYARSVATSSLASSILTSASTSSRSATSTLHSSYRYNDPLPLLHSPPLRHPGAWKDVVLSPESSVGVLNSPISPSRFLSAWSGSLAFAARFCSYTNYPIFASTALQHTRSSSHSTSFAQESSSRDNQYHTTNVSVHTTPPHTTSVTPPHTACPPRMPLSEFGPGSSLTTMTTMHAGPSPKAHGHSPITSRAFGPGLSPTAYGPGPGPSPTNPFSPQSHGPTKSPTTTLSSEPFSRPVSAGSFTRPLSRDQPTHKASISTALANMNLKSAGTSRTSSPGGDGRDVFVHSAFNRANPPNPPNPPNPRPYPWMFGTAREYQGGRRMSIVEPEKRVAKPEKRMSVIEMTIPESQPTTDVFSRSRHESAPMPMPGRRTDDKSKSPIVINDSPKVGSDSTSQSTPLAPFGHIWPPPVINDSGKKGRQSKELKPVPARSFITPLNLPPTPAMTHVKQSTLVVDDEPKDRDKDQEAGPSQLSVLRSMLTTVPPPTAFGTALQEFVSMPATKARPNRAIVMTKTLMKDALGVLLDPHTDELLKDYVPLEKKKEDEKSDGTRRKMSVAIDSADHTSLKTTCNHFSWLFEY